MYQIRNQWDNPHPMVVFLQFFMGVQFSKSAQMFHVFCVFCNAEAILGNGNTIFGIREEICIQWWYFL